MEPEQTQTLEIETTNQLGMPKESFDKLNLGENTVTRKQNKTKNSKITITNNVLSYIMGVKLSKNDLVATTTANDTEFKAGKYHSNVKVKHDNQIFSYQKDFVIDSSPDNTINNEIISPDLTKTTPWHIMIMIVLLSSIIILLLALLKRKKVGSSTRKAMQRNKSNIKKLYYP